MDSNTIKNLYSVIVYHLYVVAGEFNGFHSKMFAILDTPPAIIIQTLFLAIPYMMWKSVMNILSKMHLERSIEEQEFLNYYTFYLIIRAVILFLPLLALVIMPVDRSSTANFVKLAMQLLDSMFCSILLLGSLSSFLKRFKQIKLDSQQDKKKLKWEYALMVASSSLRLIIDLAFLIILPMFQSSDCISPISDHYYFSIGYTLIGTFTMHFIPICIVLYMYKPRAQDIQLREAEAYD